MNTSRSHQLAATLALAALIGAAALVATPATASNGRSSTSDDTSQNSMCAPESALIHRPVDVGRARPNGVHLPQ